MRFLVIVAVLLAALAGCAKQAGEGTKYHCPMHPTYVSERPGDCPICGMRLVPIGQDKAGGQGAASQAAHDHAAPAGQKPTTGYVCPMEECNVHQEGPGVCPKCGMDLVPVRPGADAPKPVSGLATVETMPEGARLAGVQVAVARRERLDRTLRTVGTVVADESRVHRITTKIEGWVEKLHVATTGAEVRKGQPLLSLYSPELLATQEEFLRAREASARFAGSSLPEVRRGGEDLLNAARRRLELFDVPKAFIDRLARTGKVERAVTLPSPATGVVTEKKVVAGQQVMPGMELFTVTDLGRVWVVADVYEGEARRVRIGQAATVGTAFDPSLRLEGKVTFVSPVLDPASRTLPVRLEFPNPGMRLKPAMFADVEMPLESAEGVVVPDTAVMDTGTRQVVFVTPGGGKFVPREVRVAFRSGGRALLESGLEAGEQVAVAANFLLDSESRLRSAILAPAAPAPAATAAPAAAPAPAVPAGHEGHGGAP